jgi:hypothetical protein
VKWRADHPVATNEDLRIRALMSKSTAIHVYQYVRTGRTFKRYHTRLSSEEWKPFVASFIFVPNPIAVNTIPKGTSGVPMGVSGTFSISCSDDKPGTGRYVDAQINLSVDARQGKVILVKPNQQIEYYLHPTSAKKWVDLLLNQPRVGAAFRKRM